MQSVSEERWCQAPAWCKPVQHFLCKRPSGGLRLFFPCREGWCAFVGSTGRMISPDGFVADKAFPGMAELPGVSTGVGLMPVRRGL